MGREKNAADTKVFIVSHSDLLWMNLKKEWIPLLLFKLTVWIVPIFVVGAGFSLCCCVSRFLWVFVLLSLICSSFYSHWHMEQVLVTALKCWLCCMAMLLVILVIVTGGMHKVLAPVVPKGNVPQEEMGSTRKCDSHCTRGSLLSTWAWRQVQIFPPGAHRKQHGQCLTFL